MNLNFLYVIGDDNLCEILLPLSPFIFVYYLQSSSLGQRRICDVNCFSRCFYISIDGYWRGEKVLSWQNWSQINAAIPRLEEWLSFARVFGQYEASPLVGEKTLKKQFVLNVTKCCFYSAFLNGTKELHFWNSQSHERASCKFGNIFLEWFDLWKVFSIPVSLFVGNRQNWWIPIKYAMVKWKFKSSDDIT